MTKQLTVFCTFIFITLSPSLSWCRQGAVKLPDVYPNAELVESEDEFRRNHPLISSAMKKVNGEVKADGEQWRDGFLSRRVYLVPDGTSSLEIFEYYATYFRSAGVREIYTCQRFHCGDSNFWANNVFNIPLLYGLDKEQAYFTGELSDGVHKEFVAVYAVKRGNRRTYVLVDVFSESSPSNANVPHTPDDNGYRKLKSNGYLALPVNGANYQPVLDSICSILSNHTALRVIISLTTLPPMSLTAFDATYLRATQELKTITDVIAKKGIKVQQYRVIYGGINLKQQSSERVLTVTLVE